MSSGGIIGGPSQKYSGIVDLRGLQELEARVAALEESGVGVGKRIVYGSAALEWVVKGHESAQTIVATGLTVVEFTAASYQTAPQIAATAGLAGGGNIAIQAYDSVAEIPAGTKATALWIAIGK